MELWQQFQKAGLGRSEGRARSHYSVRVGADQNIKPRLKKSPYIKGLLRVVDRAEGTRSHLALDLLRGVGRVHL